MASTRTLTKSALSALRTSRAAKLSLSQSGSLLHRSRAARAVSTFTSPPYLSSRTRVFDGIAENDVVSVKLSLASGGGFARRFHSSTPLQSSAASSASQANQDEFTDLAWEGFINAFDAAIVCGQKVVDSEHLMKSLLELNGDLARRIFTKAGSDYFSVWQATEDFISQQPQVTDRRSARYMGPHIVSILDNALKIKKQMGDDFASVEHLLMAFHSDKRFGQELFKNLELTEIKLKDAITDIRANHKVTNRRPGELYEALKKYGNDLTELARRGKLDPVVGRDDEIRQCIQILSRRTKNNPVIIGEPGVGKTAIAGGLALRIMRGDVPEPLLNRKISSADYERGCSRTTAK